MFRFMPEMASDYREILFAKRGTVIDDATTRGNFKKLLYVTRMASVRAKGGRGRRGYY